MQIYELTQKKKSELDEGFGSAIGGLAGAGVNAIKDVGSAIASPFKDVGQSYTSARQDQKVSAMADKAFRVWGNYVAQLEQSIAKQPAPVTKKEPEKEEPPVGGANANATKDAAAPGAPTTANATPGTTATPAPTTATAKPNYGAQTGAGTTVTYKQPTSVPNPNAPQPTNPKAIGPTTPGVTTTTPYGTTSTPAKTVASTAPGQPITVGGQKIKPGQPGYDQLAKATLKELQAPVAVSPALAAFRDRTDGKYEQYLRAFVQKNLLAGMGSRELVNSAEIDNAIKEISKPENADTAKQKPLWTDLVRAAALSSPAARSLIDRGTTKPAGTLDATKPGAEPAADATPKEPAKPTMTATQISQWISRNSEDHAALKAALDAINAVKV